MENSLLFNWNHKMQNNKGAFWNQLVMNVILLLFNEFYAVKDMQTVQNVLL